MKNNKKREERLFQKGRGKAKRKKIERKKTFRSRAEKKVI